MRRRSLLGLLFLASAWLAAAPARAGSWKASAANMNAARERMSLTVLPDGRVLAAGGSSAGIVKTSEIYDSAAGGWTNLPDMSRPRRDHAAIVLPNGKVLVAGGEGPGATAHWDSEIFDPAAESWSPAGVMTSTHNYAGAVLLKDGRVMIAGGYDNNAATKAVTIYISSTSSWMAAAPMSKARGILSLTVLPDGKVLAAGGESAPGSYHNDGEVYDPETNSWSAVGNTMSAALRSRAAVLSRTGKVLLVGGEDSVGSSSSLCDQYDPIANTFASCTSMTTARKLHSAAALPDGRVLVMGGNTGAASPTAQSQIFNPSTGGWEAEVSMGTGRESAGSAVLPDGKVMIAGGSNSGALNTVTFFVPDTKAWSSAGTFTGVRGYHTATVLPDGKVLLAGGYDGANSLDTCRLYTPGSGWSVTGSMNQKRRSHSAVLLPGGKVLVVGGYDAGTSQALGSAELYDPDTGTWVEVSSMSTARYAHAAVLLRDGRVAVFGGFDGTSTFSSVEIYDEAGWRAGASMLGGARREHTATLLRDGRVFVAGGHSGAGFLDTGILYDPDSDSWSSVTGSLALRKGHTATLLQDGRVAIIGGQNSTALVVSIVVYTPGGSYTASGNMVAGRLEHTATLLPGGLVAIVGGRDDFFNYKSNVELFDPAGGNDTLSANSLASLRGGHATVLLGDGRLLVSGGYDGTNHLNSNDIALYTEYDYSAANASHLRPVITDIGGDSGFPVSVTTGTYTLNGSTFTGNFVGNGGLARGGSNGYYPRVLLMPLGQSGSGSLGTLSGSGQGLGGAVDVSSTAYGTTMLDNFNQFKSTRTLDFRIENGQFGCGYYQLAVGANAAYSEGKVLRIADPAITEQPQAPSVSAVSTGALAAAWSDLPTQAKDYWVVEASTASNFSGGKDVKVSTRTPALTADLRGLVPNTTYYLQAAAANCLGAGPYASFSATSTLANKVSGVQIYAAHVTSATLNWAPLPTAAAAGSSSTSEGYILQASENSDFSGQVFYSSVSLVGFSTLTVTGLNAGATYYFRVGSLNWNSNANYSSTVSVRLQGWLSQWTDLEGEDSRDAAWGDFDNDGDLDFVVANAGGSGGLLRVYRNNGDGTFAAVWNNGSLGDNRAAAVGDVDGDGDLDFVAARSGAGNVVYRNDGGLSFSLLWTAAENDASESVSLGDYDNDGHIDMVVGNASGQNNRVYHNDGDGTFTLAWTSGDVLDTYGVAWGDFDDDGDLDFAAANNGGANHVVRNDGGGVFVSAWDDGGTAPTVGVAWGDIDNDGHLDLAFANNGAADAVYRQAGPASFVSVWTAPTARSGTDVSLGDFNNDGYLDLAVANSGQGDQIFLNQGGSSFSQVWSSPEASQTESIDFGDFAEDGSLDILAAYNGAASNRVYRGSFTVANSSPSAPGGFSFSFAGGVDVSTLTVKWSGGSYDGGLSSASVYYSVALATGPTTLSGDAMRIVSPYGGNASSWAVSGAFGSPLLGKPLRPAYRIWPGDSVPKHGVSISTIANLAGGRLLSETTYYLRVQAVDAGLRRSSWSAEYAFNTGPLCAPRTSVQSGDWSDPDTWAGEGVNIPNGCSEATISAGHVVTVDTGSLVASTLTILGTLTFKRLAVSSLTVEGGEINVEPGGTLDMGTAADPMVGASTAALILARGSAPGQFGLIVKDGGNFTAFGATKSAYGSITDFGACAATCTDFNISASSVVGWNAGDKITIGPKNGSAMTTEHTITSIGGGGASRTVFFTPSLAGPIPIDPEEPVYAANLTRNVLIRSSGTNTSAAGDSAYIKSLVQNATSFYVRNAEFAYIGADAGDNNKWGVRLAGRGDVSTSTFHDGYFGLYLQGVSESTFSYNVAHDNGRSGFFASGGSRNRLQGNLVSDSAEYGMFLQSSSKEYLLLENLACSNTQFGFYVTGNSGKHRFADNRAFFNGSAGFFLDGGGHNLLAGDRSYRNSGEGVRINNGSARNLLFGAVVRRNGPGPGLWINASTGTAVVESDISLNFSTGVRLAGGAHDTVFSTVSSHGNTGYGLEVGDAMRTVYFDGTIGRDRAGNPSGNSLGSLRMDPAASPETVAAWDVATEDSPVSTAAFNNSGSYLISYDFYASSTRIGINGSFTISDSTFSVAYSSQVFSSTATTPTLHRGSGHGARVVRTFDANAVNQMIVIEYQGGQWHVDGTRSGEDMAAPFSGSQVLNIPASNTQFQLDFTEGAAPREGDIVTFLLAAASGDANKDKRLELGPADPSFNQGMSKITVAPSGGLYFEGRPGAYALVDRMDSGSTFYSLVSSGAFTAYYTSFTNAGHRGVELSGDKGVRISSSSFDYLGFFTGAEHRYLTFRDLTAKTTFHAVSFGMSRSSSGFSPVYNVRVDPPDGNLEVYFVGVSSELGNYWGEDLDDDANGRVVWNDYTCMEHSVVVNNGNWSDPDTWVPPFVPAGCTPVTVPQGFTVIVDTPVATSSSTLVYGALKFGRAANSALTLAGADISVEPGGVLDMGSAQDPIPAGKSAALVLASGTVAGQYGLTVKNGGNFTVFGATKSPFGFTPTVFTPAITNNFLMAASSSTGWGAGDEIAIGPTSGNGTATTEKFRITGVAGGPDPVTVNMDGLIAAGRTPSEQSPIVVTNITRNVVVRSSGTDTSLNTAYVRALTKNATSFMVYYGEFAYLGTNASGKYGVTLDGDGVAAHFASASFHGGYTGLYLDGADSVTVEDGVFHFNRTTGVYLTNGADGNFFSYGTIYGSGGHGVRLDTGSDSNSFTADRAYSNARDGYYLNFPSDSNNFDSVWTYANASNGMEMNFSNFNTVSRSTSYLNAAEGLYMTNSASNTVRLGVYRNNTRGVYLQGATGGSRANKIEGNRVYSNISHGIWMQTNADRNVIAGNEVYGNDNGIVLSSSFDQTVLNNRVRSNANRGFWLGDSDGGLFVGNISSGNAASGIELSGGSERNIFLDAYSYANTSHGFFSNGASSNVFVGGALGYRESGTGATNGGSEAAFAPGSVNSLILKGARLEPAGGAATIPSTGFDAANDYLLSYNQDYDTGTVRIHGHYVVSESTLSLVISSNVYSSTATVPVLLRGTGHSLTVSATYDDRAESQLVTFERRGGQWHVDGSAGGADLIAPFTGNLSGTDIPSGSPQFRADFTEGTNVQDGDRLDFVLISSSADKGYKKALYFGDSAAAFNQGRSRLSVLPGAGIELVGQDASPTLVDRLDGASTYYSFVSSGAFTARFAAFKNMDSDGIQLSGDGGVALSSSVFDFLGFVTSTSSYLTARDLTANIVIDSVTFHAGRAQAGDTFYNVRAEGDVSNLRLLFTTENLGSRWGEGFDADDGRKIAWLNCGPVISFQSGAWSDVLTWNNEFVPTACNATQVASPHAVTVDVMDASAIDLVVGGTLSASRAAHSRLTLRGGLTVLGSGTLDYGTEASPVPAGTTSYLILGKGSSSGQYSLTVQDGGDFTVRGATKTPYAFALAGLNLGANQLTVDASDAVNWSAGDTLVVGPTSGQGTATSEEFAISAIDAGDPRTVTLSGTLAAARVLSSTTPILVANLSRNVVVRSSGTDSGAGGDTAYIRNLTRYATSFSLVYGEFAYLGGSDVASADGIRFESAGVAGRISSSTIRHGRYGVRVNVGSPHEISRNVFYKNSQDQVNWLNVSRSTLAYNALIAGPQRGAYLFGDHANRIAGNYVFSSGGKGFYLERGSSDTLTGNYSYSNAADGMDVFAHYGGNWSSNVMVNNNVSGMTLTSVASNTFTGIYVGGNLGDGVRLSGSSYNTVEFSTMTGNSSSGVHFLGSAVGNFLGGSLAAGNAQHGIHLQSGPNYLWGNLAGGNGQQGVYIDGASGNEFIGNFAYGNTGTGIQLLGGTNQTLAEGALGYDSAGSVSANGDGDVEFEANVAAKNMSLQGVRLNDSGVKTTGFNATSYFLSSSRQSGEAGTARLWGDTSLAGSGVTLNYASDLYASSATVPVKLRGDPANSLLVCSQNETNAVSQRVTVTYVSGNWEVRGSSTGFMGQNPAGGACPAGTDFPTSTPQVNLSLTAASPKEGDRFEFFLYGASKDSNTQKKLLFGNSAPGFRGGKSRLGIGPAAAFSAVGIPGYPTVIDRLDTSSTYYLLESSGTFTAVYSSFTNMSREGIFFSGSGAISLSSSTFDYMGIAQADNAYIGVSDLSSNATFYGLEFGNSRSTAGVNAYNIKAWSAAPGPNWTLRRWHGDLGGEAEDSDPASHFTWTDLMPGVSTGVAATQTGSSVTLAFGWYAPQGDGESSGLFAGSRYFIQWSTETPSAVVWSTANAQVSQSTGPVALGAGVSHVLGGLPAAKTVYFRVWTQDDMGRYSNPSAVGSGFSSPFTYENLTPAGLGNQSNELDMTVDRGGNVHLVYDDCPLANQLRYRKRTGSGWGGVVNVGGCGAVSSPLPAVAVDLAGNPNVTWVDGSGRVVFSSSTDGGVTFNAPTILDLSGSHQDIAIDGLGRQHVVFADPSGNLKYVKFSGGAWTPAETILAGAAPSGSYMSLALDGDGRPYVVYPNGPGSPYTLDIASRAETGWKTSTILQDTNLTLASDLVIDGLGRPQVAFSSSPAGALLYMVKSAAGWSTQVVDTAGTPSTLGLALDGDGLPNIAYFDSANQDLKYARYDGVSWTTMTVHSDGDPGWQPVIALDGTGAVQIAYTNPSAAQRNVYFASWTATGFAPPMGGNPRGKVQAPTNFNPFGVWISSVGFNWSDNSSNELGFRLYLSSAGRLDDAFAVAKATNPLGPDATSDVLLSLTPNTTYRAYVAAVSSGGVVSSTGTAFTTLAAPPAVPVNPISAVFASSLAVSWSANGNPSYTEYSVEASTAADFSTTLYHPPAGPGWMVDLSTEITGITAANTTHFIRVKARNLDGDETAYVLLDSTPSLANVPATSGADFVSVSSYSVSVTWGTNGNPNDTLYRVDLATANPYSGSVSVSTRPSGAPSAVFGGLLANTTYYLAVRAVNHAGVETIGPILSSTITHMSPPTEVFFDRVSTDTIVASAYAPAPNFRNLEAGQSATAVSIDLGPYTNWKGSTWTFRASLGADREGHGAAALNGLIYAIGGEGPGFLPTLEAYDPVGDAWTTKNSMSVSRRQPGTAAYGGRLYAIGGFNGAFLNSAEEYDPATNSWSALAGMPSNRMGLGVGEVGGKLYAVGGITNATEQATNQEFDAAAKQWAGSNKAAMTTARTDVVAVSTFGKVFVLGGRDGAVSTTYDKNEAYDPGIDGWSALTPMPTPRYGAAGAAVGGKIYVFGGRNTGGQFFNYAEEYDPRADVWAARRGMNVGRAFAAAAVLDGKAYVIAGSNGSGIKSVESFDPGTSHVFAGLVPNSFHQFRAKARNALGKETAETGLFTVYTLAVEPATATPTFTGVHPSSVVFQWTSNGNTGGATPYHAQASTAADFTGTLFEMPFTVALSTALDGLSGNTTYYFRVQARNGDGIETGYTSLGSTVTAANVPVSPSLPGVQKSSITFEWGPNGNSAGTVYVAEMALTENFGTVDRSSATRSTSAVFGATGLGADLINNTTYYFRVRALNGGGAATLYTSTVAAATLVELPGQAGTPFPSVEVASITFEWTSGGNPAGTLYEADIATDAAFGTLNVTSATYSTSTLFGAGGAGAPLLTNATYYFRVRALNRAGTPTANTQVQAKATLAATPAAAPFAGVELSSITAEWSAGSNETGTVYRLDLSTDDFGTVNLSSTTRSTSVLVGTGGAGAALLQNTSYYFRVLAINREGTATPALSFSTHTRAAAPADGTPAFTGVEIGSISFQWGANGNPAGLTDYYAEVSTDAFATLNFVSSTTAAALLAGAGGVGPASLDANTTYYFRVRTKDVGGTFGAYGAQFATATLAVAPGAAGSSSVGVSSAGFSWTGVNPAGTLYEARVSTDDFATVAASSFTNAQQALFGTTGEGAALSPATTYYLRVRALNRNSVPTPFVFTVTTQTLPTEPVSAASTFTAVYRTSMTVSWGAAGNGAGTVYEAVLSTGSSGVAGFAGDVPVSTRPSGSPSASFTTLSANTTYFLYVRAVNAYGLRSPYAALGSTPTLPNEAAAAVGPSFHAANVSSVTASWSANSNPAGTAYRVAFSTDVSYPNAHAGTLELTTAPVGGEPTATVSGLASNATYYLHVAVFGHGGALTAFANVGTTVTLPAPPSSAIPTFTNVVSTEATGFWNAGGNVPGTRYEAVLSTGSGLPSSFAGDVPVSTAPEGAPGGVFAGLTPNATYYLIARTAGRGGFTTPYVLLGSTVTPAAEPVAASPSFSSGSTTGLVGAWGANGNPPDATAYDTVLSTSSALVLTDAGNVSVSTRPSGAPGAEYPGLAVNTTYHLHVRAVDRLGRPTAYVLAGSSATLANAPDDSVSVSTPFAQVDFNAVRFTWGPNGNPAGTEYVAEMATNPGFAPVDRSSVTKSTTVIFGNLGLGADLAAQATYYFRVRALSVRGEPTAFTQVRSTATLQDDVIPPTLTDNQTGDGTWRKASGTYDIDVFDTGGRHLDRIEVKASTNAGGAGPDLFGFTAVQTSLGSFGDSFTADWSLAPVFNLLQDNATNYITVRVVDGIGNATTLVDAFYVLKDTTAPVFVNSVSPGDDTPRTAAGTTYDVDAADPGSGLEAFQYSVSTTALSGDQTTIAWTSLPGLTVGATSYVANWTVDFNSLVEGTTNYVSIRAWNTAGSTRTSVDAFHVIKDTSGPGIGITAPASSFSSVLGTISGTAADLIGVQGTEVNVRVVGGNYWDPVGSAFTAGAPVWMPASGKTAWTLSPGIPWVDGTQYQIVARSSDNAGNYSVNYATAVFTLDASTPTIGIVVPADGAAISSLPQITGTANDPGASPSGLQSVAVRLKNLSDDTWWDFVNDVWTASPVSAIATGVNPWVVTPSELLKANLRHQTSYFIAVQASDNAVPQNQTDFAVGGATFTFSDTTPPSAITDLTGLAGTNPGDIRLSWSAPGDDGSSGITLLGEYRIHFSTDAATVFSTSSAQVVISTSLVAPGASQGRLLTGSNDGLSPDTTYYVRVFLKDDAGNWSPLSNGATVQSAPSPFAQIKGHVVNASSQGITAVSLVAYDGDGVSISTSLSVADGSGTYVLGGVPPGNYKVEATWEVNEIVSSVWLDGIAVGSVNIDFTLEINYTLSTVQGNLLALAAFGPSGFGVSAAGNRFSDSKIELLQRGGVVAQTGVRSDGVWRISNLLPGKYWVRAYNGIDYTDPKEIVLLEGEIQDVDFVYDPLEEDSVFAFPNPAKDEATIRFISALFPLEAQVRVFDIAGTLVREIPGTEMSSPQSGLYHAKWDLKNDSGEDVASGVYLFVVKVKGANGQSGQVTKKIAVVR